MRNRPSHPTLLVPGFASGNAQFMPFQRWLRRRNVAAECWNDAPLLYTEAMEAYAGQLARTVESLNEPNLTLVGWSYGGYVSALAAARPETRGRLKRVIAFATPFDGTDVAHLGAITDLIGLHIQEMAPGSPMLRRIERILHGARRWAFHALNGSHDALASNPQHSVPATCRIEGPWSHASLLHDRSLFRVIHTLITGP